MSLLDHAVCNAGYPSMLTLLTSPPAESQVCVFASVLSPAGLPAIISVACSPAAPLQLQEAGADALCQLATYESCRELMSAAGCVAALANLLPSSSSEVRWVQGAQMSSGPGGSPVVPALHAGHGACGNAGMHAACHYCPIPTRIHHAPAVCMACRIRALMGLAMLLPSSVPNQKVLAGDAVALGALMVGGLHSTTWTTVGC